MNTPPPTFDQQLIGQTEKTMNAILERLLASTGLSEPEWITLVLAAAADGAAGHDQLTRRVAGGLKVDQQTAARHIQALVTKGLLQLPTRDSSSIELTGAGRQLIAEIRTQTAAITRRLWGDLPDTDLNTAASVLTTVLERAEAELEAGRPTRSGRESQE